MLHKKQITNLGGSLPKPIPSDVLSFASKSEKVVAKLLEKYLHFKCLIGITYQVPIAFNKQADFFLPNENVVIEWHPINLSWEMMNRDARKSLFKSIQHLKSKDRENVIDALTAEYRTLYEVKRKFFMHNSHLPFMRSAKLIVVSEPKEFFQEVIVPFGTSNVRLETFLNDWQREFKKK